MLGLAGCASSDNLLRTEALATYGALPDEEFGIRAVDIGKLDPKFLRRTVVYESKEAAGMIVVDPKT